MNDAQISSAYVAYNLHHLSSLAGTPVAVIGHSQGSPNVQWALRFFPSTRDPAVTRSFVALSPDFSGVGFDGLTELCDIVSGVPLCAPSLWQQAKGSNYMAALAGGSHGIDQAYVPTTVVWSVTDEVVVPSFENSRLSGASIISAQDLCPTRVVGHLLMTHDAAGFAIALDALEHGGQADVARIDRAKVCLELLAPGMDPTLASLTEAGLNDIIKGIL
jgi:triacylglycerol lipase